MTEIVVINLMRLGDLIQTTPLLRAIRRAHPRARVTLVVQDVFQETAALLPHYDRLLVVELARVAPRLDQGDWRGALQQLAACLQPLRQSPPDLVINVTPNKLGAMLTYLVGGRQRRGFALAGRRQFACEPPWMAYMMTASKHRRFNPFNVIDQFTRGAGFPPTGQGVALKVPPPALKEIETWLAAAGVKPGVRLIGLQPGASAPIRQWPAENLAAVARRLLETLPCHFLLLGTDKERPLGEAIRAQLPPSAATSLMGKTSVGALAAAVQRLELLITNDTGTMHVACGVGTPVLAVFLATARILDTGPTGRSHLALAPRLDCYPCLHSESCDAPRCHQVISPAVVAELAHRKLTGAALALREDDPRWAAVTVLVSDFDRQGYQIFRPLGRRSPEPALLWAAIMKSVWLRILDGGAEPTALLADRLAEDLDRQFVLPGSRVDVQPLIAPLRYLVELAGQGQDLTGKILPHAADPHRHALNLKKWGAKLIRVDTEIGHLGEKFPELAALVEMFIFRLRCLDAAGLPELARQSHALYGHLRAEGKIFLDVLSHLALRLDSLTPAPAPGGADWAAAAPLSPGRGDGGAPGVAALA